MGLVLNQYPAMAMFTRLLFNGFFSIIITSRKILLPTQSMDYIEASIFQQGDNGN